MCSFNGFVFVQSAKVVILFFSINASFDVIVSNSATETILD